MSSYRYFKSSDYAFAANADYLSELYQKYLENPESVGANWQEYFSQLGDDQNIINNDFGKVEWIKNTAANNVGNESSIKFRNLLSSHRKYGHLAADLDPIGLTKAEGHPSLHSIRHGLTNNDKVSSSDPLLARFSNKNATQVEQELKQIYSQKIAYEFSHIEAEEELQWLYEQVEDYGLGKISISTNEKSEALNHLLRANSFEQLLHKKFPGAKRFSVEGGEVMIASLEAIIKASGENKVLNIELGMAHRGRLNVLTNIMGKPYDEMIAEFRGIYPFPEGYSITGDVKYHMGYSSDRIFDEHKTHLSLAYNPSHLEAVNSVVLGKVRAKQSLNKDTNRTKILPILIHGDAAFMGQGSVAECFNMAYTEGFNVGGSLHIILNNQIGFTANPRDSRSTRYSSDLAKFVNAPIIHVNSESVEDVLFASKLAFNYRQKFHKDFVLDIVAYRKYGHNEGDEPAYTQPVMYKRIKSLNTPDENYANKLINEKVIKEADYQELKDKRAKELEEAFQQSESWKPTKLNAFDQQWKNYTIKERAKTQNPATAISKSRITSLINHLTSYPKDFGINAKIAKQLEQKAALVKEGTSLDWSLGESLAFASLLEEGYGIRISGQDAKRGTFSHRHSVLRDSKDENEYVPLNNLGTTQETYEVYDSVLSEYTVLGFEYGYSLSLPKSLTIWEAQFGDFANGAQILFDQFISSGETKWMRTSGLTMLLPHGYEGQGPEHSSARLERYLQSCAEDNMQIANCTTPANFFHLLRRQMLRDFRKPLIVMSPKSLLRHKLATSPISDFTDNKFQTIIPHQGNLGKKVRKLILCSGKVYYDLVENLAEINDIALVRIEQLYPFPEKEIAEQLNKFKNAEIVWCQEEPANMGAYEFIIRQFNNHFQDVKIKYVGRPEAASPATGYASVHKAEQEKIFKEILK